MALALEERQHARLFLPLERAGRVIPDEGLQDLRGAVLYDLDVIVPCLPRILEERRAFLLE